MSEVDRMLLSYVEESAYGEIPAGPPTLIDLRWTGESLRQETATQDSAEIRDDRQTSEVIRTSIRSVGDLSIEFSYGTYDDLMAAALCASAWSSIVTTTEITYSMSNADNSINDSGNGFVTDGYLAGQWLEIRGFTGDAANNGYFKIVSVAAGKMVLSHGTVVDDAAGESVTLTMGAQIVNGVASRSFVIEKNYSDLSNTFSYFTGLMIDRFNLSVNAEAILTGGFNFIGKAETSNTATVGDGSNTAVNSNQVLNAVDHVIAVFENGTSLDVNTFTVELANNLRTRMVIGTLGPKSIGKGKINVSGTLQVYFESATLFNKYLNFTASNMALVAEDDAGNAYVIELPELKFISGQRVGSGENNDVIADLNWRAVRDSSEDLTIRIARFAA